MTRVARIPVTVLRAIDQWGVRVGLSGIAMAIHRELTYRADFETGEGARATVDELCEKFPDAHRRSIERGLETLRNKGGLMVRRPGGGHVEGGEGRVTIYAVRPWAYPGKPVVVARPPTPASTPASTPADLPRAGKDQVDQEDQGEGSDAQEKGARRSTAAVVARGRRGDLGDDVLVEEVGNG